MGPSFSGVRPTCTFGAMINTNTLPQAWRRSHLLAFLSAVVLLSGCLTIEENYTFKKDGSGTLEYVVDMSAMMEMMKGFEAMADKKDKKDEGPGNMDMAEDMVKLKQIPGIKKVKVKKEKDGYVQRLSFRFADLAALNKALNTLMPDSTGNETAFFTWDGNTLVRANNRHATEMGDDMASDGSGGDSTFDANTILQSMKYKYSFTFADAIAATHTADGVNKEVPSDKQVKLDTDWSVIMKDSQALDLRIDLNR